MKLFKNIKSFSKDSDQTEKIVRRIYRTKEPHLLVLKADNKIGKNW